MILQITRMVVALVLARLLTPHDWGLAGMVILFAGFTIVFTDNALGTALIQRRDVREEDKSTVFWFSAARRPRPGRRRRPGRGAVGGLLRRARCSLALRRILRGLHRQRAGYNSDGATRPRDAVPTARAPPDGCDDRRRGDRHLDRARRTRRVGDRRPAARRGGHLDGAALAADAPGDRRSSSRPPASTAWADSPAMSSRRTSSGRAREASVES